MDAYGVIWVHRGQPDRWALRAVFRGLDEGRIIAIASEGRESLTGALEEGTGGVAYIAIRADVSVLPVTITGTENQRIFRNLIRFRRTDVTLTIGPPFRLQKQSDRRESIQAGSDTIMQTLARQLLHFYRGVVPSQ